MHMHLWCRRRLCICCSVCCITLQCAFQCTFHQISCICTVAADCVFVAVCCSVCCMVLQCVLQRAFHQSWCIYSVSADCICVALCVAVCITPCCSVSCNVRFIGVRASAVSPQKVHMSQCALQCMLQRVHFVFLESSCICGSAAASVFVESTQSSSTQIRVCVKHHSYMYLS